MAEPIPEALAHLVALNVGFKVLICLQCKYVVAPTAISRHMSDRHKTPIALRKHLDEYIRGFPFEYDDTSVELPRDGSIPQPIIPVLGGGICKDCPFKSHSRPTIRQHCNQKHNKKRVPDEDMFEPVKLQCWFGEKRGRFWIVDVEAQEEQQRRQHRAATRDVGEDSDESDESDRDEDDEESEQEDVDAQITQEIKQWQTEAQERRLRLLKDVPAAEMDSWLQYTKWNEVLSQSKHNFIDTHRYTRKPDPEEPQLERLIRAWNRISERCLDTLEATDQKDALKWWASPKNEVASQHPFELPQNGRTVITYSEIFIGMVCYMIRTAPIEHETDETGN